jgi:transposase
VSKVIIGVDPHKSTHTANAVDAAADKTAGVLQIDASLTGYQRLLRWSRQFGERRWAVENARGLGRHLAQWLTARGEHVADVPSTATARVRELSRGGRRKNDIIDAAAAAAVAVMRDDANAVLAEDASIVLALLDERRGTSSQPTRLVNQLHAAGARPAGRRHRHAIASNSRAAWVMPPRAASQNLFT